VTTGAELPVQRDRTTFDRTTFDRTTFDRTTALQPMGEVHRWGAELDDAWSSLRGVHGGYMAAIAVRAFEHAHPDREVRTVHVSFVRAGAVGPAEVSVETVRRGRSITVARVSLHQDGRSVLEATVTGNNVIAIPTINPNHEATRLACAKNHVETAGAARWAQSWARVCRSPVQFSFKYLLHGILANQRGASSKILFG